jgi:peroxiredoxin
MSSRRLTCRKNGSMQAAQRKDGTARILAVFVASAAGESRSVGVAKSVVSVWRFSSLPLGEIRRLRLAKSVTSILCFALCLVVCGQSVGNTPQRRSLVGQPAPAFAVATLDGKPVSLADYRGRVVLINFWATWCGNCQVEMPWLGQLHDRYAGQGFEVLGILTDNAPLEKIAAFTKKYGVHYPILMCNHETAQAYGGLPDLPESFLIDRRGTIVAEIDGADSEQQIEAKIRSALDEEKGH